MPWIPGVKMREQPRYIKNKECLLWSRYNGANEWEIFELVPRTEDEKKGAGESNLCVLCAMEARISLMMRSGDVGAVGTTDKAAMGYYLVKWLTEPYTLQAETEGMAGMIGAGTLVLKGVYFNRVRGALYW